MRAILMTLRIGKISYANVTPIFTALMRNFTTDSYQIVQGVPSHLNALLANGDIDLCPSSSIAYAKSPDLYYLLPDLSISSVGPVKSVLLFSRLPLNELEGCTVGLTTDSDTSVNLLRIVLARSHGLSNRFERTSLPLAQALETFPATLLIGDAALRGSMDERVEHVYDLGEEWFRFTGLPFVFALWIVRREAVEEKYSEVAALLSHLREAKRIAYESYEAIAATCEEEGWMERERLVDYWRCISYDLTPFHLQGVKEFFRHATEMGILPREPVIRIFPER
ncbi:MAG TPA: menaquinone biosynthesis protein [Geomobilimonas sp.]|nr:menaquinone biosynthesis protein [Geomobilimonas sp.]